MHRNDEQRNRNVLCVGGSAHGKRVSTKDHHLSVQINNIDGEPIRVDVYRRVNLSKKITHFASEKGTPGFIHAYLDVFALTQIPDSDVIEMLKTMGEEIGEHLVTEVARQYGRKDGTLETE